VVVDANVAIAICAKEPDKFAIATAQIQTYAMDGSRFYAPGVIGGECLYVFCRKLQAGDLTATEHANAIKAFITFMGAVEPPPAGDKSLIQRAEDFRGVLGCSRSADGIYLALAEELAKSSTTEVITFDNGMQTQGVANSLTPQVVVLPTTPPPLSAPPPTP
jgi:predicted nucleic acid-binding protein